MVQGRKASEVAELDKDELLEEIGIPLTPIRLKCAMLGLTTLKVALHKAKGTPLPRASPGYDELSPELVALIDVCPVEELPPGSMKLVPAGSITVGVYNCNGELLRDRGPLLARRRAALRGRLGPETCVVICPRHGSAFDIRTSGRPLTLPAYAARRLLPGRRRGRLREGRRVLSAQLGADRVEAATPAWSTSIATMSSW